MIRNSLSLVSLLIIVGLFGCGTSTDLTDSSRFAENQTGDISKILIVGVSDNVPVRNLFEKEMEKNIEKYKTVAMRSLEAMPSEAAIDRESFETYFKSQQIDAVLITRLVDQEKIGLYAEGTDTSTPQAVAATYYDHYQNTYERYAEVGHFDYATILRVETSIFDVETGNMIWQCHSKSFRKDNTEEVLADLAKLLAKTMKGDGVI